MVLCGPPISPLGTFPGTFMNMQFSALARVCPAEEQLGCGLAVSDAEEEPEAPRLLPFQLWAGGRMALPTSLVCCVAVVVPPHCP